jgi:uncharacterized protein (TIGR03083 family)
MDPMLSEHDYVAILRGAAHRLVEDGCRALDLPVPSCPGWAVRDLLFHVGHVAAYVHACFVAGGPQPDYRDPELPPDAELCDWMSEQVANVEARIARTAPAAAVWNWSVGSQTASFWPRHLAHEAQVHLWDLHHALDRDRRGPGAAERTTALAELGSTSPAAVAVDGIDEILRIHLPARRRDDAELIERGRARVVAADAGIVWDVDLAGDSVVTGRLRGPDAEPDADPGQQVVLRGSSEDLYLALWGRVPLPAPTGATRDARQICDALVSG